MYLCLFAKRAAAKNYLSSVNTAHLHVYANEMCGARMHRVRTRDGYKYIISSLIRRSASQSSYRAHLDSRGNGIAFYLCSEFAETRDISLETVTMSTERKVDLTYEDILGLKTQRAIVLVDVRDHNEIQETGKLPDSIHIPRECPIALRIALKKMAGIASY
ncbi:Hypothetical predicted protein [Cloeon dipterum]|uniref:Rhodanese domain-containing protein n=1 Tax=Cloeon dipterum TaxID=197152 RepID=A0A8S1DQ20_9INSE|nr:Hypothetical predicted protein [Cloeon dipterum]